MLHFEFELLQFECWRLDFLLQPVFLNLSLELLIAQTLLLDHLFEELDVFLQFDDEFRLLILLSLCSDLFVHHMSRFATFAC